MTYMDKTFCASPNCKDKCGRKMMEVTKKMIPDWERISFAEFCDENGEVIDEV